MSYSITAVQTTIFKSLYLQAEKLNEDSKFNVSKGSEFKVNWFKKVEDHYYFELDSPVKGRYNYFAYAPHVKVGNLAYKDFNLRNDFASRIIAYMLGHGYKVEQGEGNYNIVYVEGCNHSGALNSDTPNQFNDRRLIVEVHQGSPKIVGNWEATSEPGSFYTNHPMNPGGAARIKFGQYINAWKIGMHGKSARHEALIQVRPITVYRDYNRNHSRVDDRQDTGLFGVNQHGGYDYPFNNIGKASAGCLVGRTMKGHREFMSYLKTRRRSEYTTTIIPGNELPD